MKTESVNGLPRKSNCSLRSLGDLSWKRKTEPGILAFAPFPLKSAGEGEEMRSSPAYNVWSSYGYLTTTDVKSRFQSAVAEAFAKICTVCSPAIGTVTTD
jgi:hypothetical protein